MVWSRKQKPLHMKNHIFLFQIFEKIDRPKLRLLFSELVSHFADRPIHQEQVRILLDCLMMVITRDSDVDRSDKNLEYLKEYFSEIQQDWEQTVSRFSLKCSKVRRTQSCDWEQARYALELLLGNKERTEVFLQTLYLEISMAEYRGVPFPEPPVEVPNSMLPTAERRTFFTSVVSLDTLWRK